MNLKFLLNHLAALKLTHLLTLFILFMHFSKFLTHLCVAVYTLLTFIFSLDSITHIVTLYCEYWLRTFFSQELVVFEFLLFCHRLHSKISFYAYTSDQVGIFFGGGNSKLGFRGGKNENGTKKNKKFLQNFFQWNDEHSPVHELAGGLNAVLSGAEGLQHDMPAHIFPSRKPGQSVGTLFPRGGHNIGLFVMSLLSFYTTNFSVNVNCKHKNFNICTDQCKPDKNSVWNFWISFFILINLNHDCK